MATCGAGQLNDSRHTGRAGLPIEGKLDKRFRICVGQTAGLRAVEELNELPEIEIERLSAEETPRKNGKRVPPAVNVDATVR
jgi:hypothetical protein